MHASSSSPFAIINRLEFRHGDAVMAVRPNACVRCMYVVLIDEFEILFQENFQSS